YPLPTPSQITVEGDHTLQVKSLQGVTVLDTQLKRVKDAAGQPSKVQSPTPSEQLFPDISHYIDNKLGTHWVYTGDGELITYNPTTQEYKTTFIGNLQSGRAVVRIFPYEDEVLVLMDYRLL